MQKVGLIGWRGMVGSVLMERMQQENDFALIDAVFFSTSQAGKKAPSFGGKDNGVLQDAYNLDALKANGRKTLVILPENSNNIFLSSRNLPEVKVITIDEINTYTLVDANHLVMVDGVQDIIAERRK